MNQDPDTDLDPAFQVNPDPIRIHGFDDQKLKKKNTAENFVYLFVIKNCNLLMPIQATEEAVSPQKRTSSTSNEIYLLFSMFVAVCHFCRIANPDPDTDPGTPVNRDPIPSGSGSTALVCGTGSVTVHLSCEGPDPCSDLDLESRCLNCTKQFGNKIS